MLLEVKHLAVDPTLKNFYCSITFFSNWTKGNRREEVNKMILNLILVEVYFMKKSLSVLRKGFIKNLNMHIK